MGCLSSYERNILSHAIVAGTGIAVTALTVARVSSPWIAFGATILYSCAHWIYRDRRTDDYKEQIKINEQEIKLQEREIRRLSLTRESTKDSATNTSEGTKSVDIDAFELEFKN